MGVEDWEGSCDLAYGLMRIVLPFVIFRLYILEML